MFTGIIKNKAQFVSLKKYKSKYFLTLNSVQRFTNKDIGSSISINGICLTLIKAKSIKNKVALSDLPNAHDFLFAYAQT